MAGHGLRLSYLVDCDVGDEPRRGSVRPARLQALSHVDGFTRFSFIWKIFLSTIKCSTISQHIFTQNSCKIACFVIPRMKGNKGRRFLKETCTTVSFKNERMSATKQIHEEVLIKLIPTITFCGQRDEQKFPSRQRLVQRRQSDFWELPALQIITAWQSQPAFGWWWLVAVSKFWILFFIPLQRASRKWPRKVNVRRYNEDISEHCGELLDEHRILDVRQCSFLRVLGRVYSRFKSIEICLEASENALFSLIVVEHFQRSSTFSFICGSPIFIRVFEISPDGILWYHL